jgi:hypothetical protein
LLIFGAFIQNSGTVNIEKKYFSERMSGDFKCEAAKIESKSVRIIHSQQYRTFNIDYPQAVNR